MLRETEGLGQAQSLRAVAWKPGDLASLNRRAVQACLCVLSCPAPPLSIGAWGWLGELGPGRESILTSGHLDAQAPGAT